MWMKVSMMKNTNNRRTSSGDGAAQATCACGGAWFELRRSSAGETEPGMVCLDERGFVTGVVGEAFCSDCGREWTPPRSRLHVVE